MVISDSSENRLRAGVTIASSIRFEDVSHTYGANDTLKGIDLNIRPGEVVCLLGPSGSGKTTLLRLAAGLAEVKSGKILINDREVSSAGGQVPPEKRGVGLVFQDFALFPHMTIQKNVEFGLTELGRSDRAEHALRMLETVGLRSRADSYPASLSGGEQQRVALARALAPKPGILLMDEPFSGLDARLRDAVRDETLALLRDTRSTVLMVTHDPEEAMMISDRIVLMRAGEIIQQGSSEDLYRKPNSLFSAKFFSQLNIVEGVFDGKVVTSVIGQFKLNVSEDKAVSGNTYDICLRPGEFTIQTAHLINGKKVQLESKPEKGSRKLSGFVLSRRLVGDADHLQVAVEGLEKPLHLNTRQLGSIGPVSAIEFSANVNGAFLFGHSRS